MEIIVSSAETTKPRSSSQNCGFVEDMRVLPREAVGSEVEFRIEEECGIDHTPPVDDD